MYSNCLPLLLHQSQQKSCVRQGTAVWLQDVDDSECLHEIYQTAELEWLQDALPGFYPPAGNSQGESGLKEVC